MEINEILLKNYINNASDIKAFLEDDNFNILLNKIDNNKIITVNSHLIHKENICALEQFIYNFDNYISFIKKHLMLNQFEIRYIISLTLLNKNNKILYSNIYFYDNKDFYINGFKKLFMYMYLKNVKILKKYIKIQKMDFNELITKLNLINNKAHFYFEDISKNLHYYINIIDYLENTSNM